MKEMVIGWIGIIRLHICSSDGGGSFTILIFFIPSDHAVHCLIVAANAEQGVLFFRKVTLCRFLDLYP